MSNAGEILSVSPRYAISGGEITIECKDFRVSDEGYGCNIGGAKCKIVGASSTKVVALIPDDIETGRQNIHLESAGSQTAPYEVVIGRRLVSDMHIVANPAIDPRDDSIFITRSGSRGQELNNTLFRYDPEGYLDELPAQIKNPTGLAFDEVGDLYVSNRSDGDIYRVLRGDEVQLYASQLGIATGIGTVIGAVAGGKKGAAVGAGVGAGAGTGAVLMTRGDAAVLPAESVVSFRLASPLRITQQI